MKLNGLTSLFAGCIATSIATVHMCTAETFTVVAKANIFRAGHGLVEATPYEYGGGVPPVEFVFPAQTYRVLVFSRVEGSVDFGNPTAPNGPDGGNFGYRIAPLSGISGIEGPALGFLAGVFLDSNEPKDPPPKTLEFTTVGTNFGSLAPEIGQVFFIGDGRTESGILQEFIVPPTATRLYLGFADAHRHNGIPGYYHDNTGFFTVGVDALPHLQSRELASGSPVSGVTGPQNPVVDHTVSGDPVSAPVGWPTSERSGGAIQLYSALSESIPLPKDKAFGYALPAEVTLSHHIEASTNLIQWTEITNPALFFKDSDSTNFTHRFYRFSE